MELRRVVEPAAAALAAQRVDPERLARMKAAHNGMRDNVEDVALFLNADADFHAALLAASGNALLERLSTVIGPVLSMAFLLQAEERWRFKSAVEKHAAVYEAIARGDPRAAYDRMAEIVSSGQDAIERILGQHERLQPY
jgi:DNA-binding FadR family transcriptional regulator